MHFVYTCKFLCVHVFVFGGGRVGWMVELKGPVMSVITCHYVGVQFLKSIHFFYHEITRIDILDLLGLASVSMITNRLGLRTSVIAFTC